MSDALLFVGILLIGGTVLGLALRFVEWTEGKLREWYRKRRSARKSGGT